MGDKIVELQGLRCIAIISVLFFHIWPDVFCNGFLGVDIFFVISGYIMAVILLSNDLLKTSFTATTLIFYYRRIYRILPLYLLNILATLIFIPVFSYSYYYSNILAQVKTALLFSTNFSMFFSKNYYFTPGLSYNWFKHYWSLCVEMQFYAIVPFIFFVSKKLPLSVNLFIFWPAIIILSVALIFYVLFEYEQIGAFFTFTMLPARIYEFIGGFVAFHAQEFIILNDQKLMLKIKRMIQNVVTTNLLTITLPTITLLPIKLNDIYSLPIVVIISSAIIVSISKKKQKNEIKYCILAHKLFVFIGDASYSLYICHWGIVHLCKLIFEDNTQNRQIVLVFCVIVGIIIHKFIEQPIVKARLKPEQFFPWVILGYLAIGFISSTNNFSRPISDITKTLFHNQSKHIINASKWEEITRDIHPDISAEIGMYSWETVCKNDGPNLYGSGNVSILLLGNSHAGCFLPALDLATKGIYSNIREFIIGGSLPFESFKSSKQISKFKQAVIEFKPDVIFLIFKYMDDFDEPSYGPIDIHLQSMQEMINFLSKNTKALFISEMHFFGFGFTSMKWAENVWRKGWTDNYLDIENLHVVSTKRWKEIECENCIFLNMLEPFCSNGWCSLLDKSRKVPLLFDDNHLTKFGSYMLIPYIQKHFKTMFKLLN